MFLGAPRAQAACRLAVSGMGCKIGFGIISLFLFHFTILQSLTASEEPRKVGYLLVTHDEAIASLSQR